MKSFDNKVVWITGASSGIGEALALAFAKGAKLVLTARRRQELARVKTRAGLPDSSITSSYGCNRIWKSAIGRWSDHQNFRKDRYHGAHNAGVARDPTL